MTQCKSSRPGWRPLLTALALLSVALPAAAQYQWRDESGRMIFSDQPPPASVSPSRILRAQPMPAVPAPATAAASNPTPAMSRADIELQRKRQAQEKEAADKLAQQKAQQSARLARACEDLRGELRTLDSGMRMARVNANGEREYLSDDERAQRTTMLQRDLADNCK